MAEKTDKLPDTVEEYIVQYPPEQRQILEKARQIIREAAPKATEKISWAMPTYHQGENLVHFAMHKNHLGFYPSPEAIIAFKEKLQPYKTTKGGIQFPLSKPVPFTLIREITLYRVAEVEKNNRSKKG
ncbi:DUF1801 domain-containing protein [Ruminococcaceae bacterium OttesenSCG-928-I18]|nr:DUF1801 domain-containing protein [Ruminococcaceae bacterium OttesenSCG-928-I18]